MHYICIYCKPNFICNNFILRFTKDTCKQICGDYIFVIKTSFLDSNIPESFNFWFVARNIDKHEAREPGEIFLPQIEVGLQYYLFMFPLEFSDHFYLRSSLSCSSYSSGKKNNRNYSCCDTINISTNQHLKGEEFHWLYKCRESTCISDAGSVK